MLKATCRFRSCRLVGARLFFPNFDEQSCVNRSWTDEKRFYELEAGLMKEFLVN